MQELIYIAEDEQNIRDLISSFLDDAGYKAVPFENGDLLFAAFKEKEADLVILDIMMPGTDGLTICKNIREISTVPIIVLTAKESEMDYVMGINMGGDDYLTKPFRPTILMMRVKSLLRRAQMTSTRESDEIIFGDINYSPENRTILVREDELRLTSTEFQVLSYLLKNKDKSISREELLEEIWGYDSEVETRVTDETIRRVRKKLDGANSNVYIETQWGFGYKLTVLENKND
jgi:two-component system response regulator ResD